jgi:hypothetical protein
MLHDALETLRKDLKYLTARSFLPLIIAGLFAVGLLVVLAVVVLR